MSPVMTLAIKDLRLLLRDRAGFFFTFFFPLLMAVFFGTIFSGGGGGERGMAIVVVDEDSSAASRKFIDRLAGSAALSVEMAGRVDAERSVRLGKRAAYVVLTKGFGEARERLFYGEAPTVELGVDPARKAEAGLLEGVLMKHGAESMQETLADANLLRVMLGKAIDSLHSPGARQYAGRDKLLRFLPEVDQFLGGAADSGAGGFTEANGFQGLQPLIVRQAAVVRERTGPQNAYEISFPQGIVWGMIGCAAAFGISLVLERTRGTLIRLRIAPITRSQILAGKALACFVTTMFISVSLLIIAFAFFDVVPGSIIHAGLAVLSVCVAFVGIMMLLAVLGKTERSAGGIGWAALLVMSMIGGGMVPLFVMPSWMQTLSNVSPVKWSILAIEGALWRHFTLPEMALPCGILLAVGMACFAVGVKVFRWTDSA